jgi:ElaB/YqjD/DUF883 family membrane-anchored ribosome-binding protein
MNPEKLEGKVNNGVGKAEEAVGEVVGDPGLQVRGEARQFEGAAEEAAGSAKEKLTEAAKQARAAVADAADKASDAYQTLRVQAQSVADTVDPFVKERPYAAVAVAALAGVILGALLFTGGPKVIYVKPAPRA